jgi:hypothetical protein
MIAKLYFYFGFVGVASVVLWMVAVLWACLHLCSVRRYVHLYASLGMALAAFVLARVNSAQVSRIETDRSDDIAASRQVLADMQSQSHVDGKVSGVRFVEDAPAEAGAGSAQKGAGQTGAVLEASAPAADSAGEPAYRKLGKQKRDAGKRQPIATSTAAKVTEALPNVRTMKEADALRANQLDRYNLLAVRLVLLLALGLIVWDYGRRFNRTDGPYFPLPLAGHLLESVFHGKSHSVLLKSVTEERLKRFMEWSVRKGETFIYFGPRDPWEAADFLPRLSVARRAIWSLRKLSYGTPSIPRTGEFFFDAAWFDRYCVVIPAPAAATGLLAELLDYLRTRRLTSAATRRLVNVVWNLSSVPDPEAIKELAHLASTTNLRFVLVAPNAAADLSNAFDECPQDFGPA